MQIPKNPTILEFHPGDSCCGLSGAGQFTAQVPEQQASDAKKKRTLVWAPALSTEPVEMLRDWIRDVTDAGFDDCFLVINGPGAESTCNELCKITKEYKALIHWVSGSASIGTAQTLAAQLFLQNSAADYIVRIDSDGQFPVQCIGQMLQLFDLKIPPDIVVGQRDDIGAGGRLRWLGNFIL